MDINSELSDYATFSNTYKSVNYDPAFQKMR